MSFNQLKSTKIYGTFQNSNFTGSPAVTASAVFDGSCSIVGDTTVTKLKAKDQITFINSSGNEKSSIYYDNAAHRYMFAYTDPSCNGFFFQNSSGQINIYFNNAGGLLCESIQSVSLYSASAYFPLITAATIQVDTNLVANLGGGTLINISPIELSYLDGITSNIQSQINSKGSLSSANTWSGVNTFTNNIIANSLTISPIELSYLDGITSNIQSQINSKGSLSSANTWSGVNTFTNNIIANTLTITPSEISYLDGVTSNIQSQLNNISLSSASLSSNNIFTGNNTFSDIYSNNNHYFKADGSQSIYFSSVLGQIGGSGNTAYTRMFGLLNTTFLDFNEIIKFRACDLSGNSTGATFEMNQSGLFSAPNIVTDNIYSNNNHYFKADGSQSIYFSSVLGQIGGSGNTAYTRIFGLLNTTYLDFNEIIKFRACDLSGNSTGATFEMNQSGLFSAPNIVTDNMYITTSLNVGSTIISPTELSYLDNVSSNLQTQLNGKASLSSTQTFTNINTFNENTTFRKQIIFKPTTSFQNNLIWSDSTNNVLSLFIYNSNKQSFNIVDASSTGWVFTKTGTNVLTISDTGKLTTSSGSITDLSCNMLEITTGIILPANSIYDGCLSTNVPFLGASQKFLATNTFAEKLYCEKSITFNPIGSNYIQWTDSSGNSLSTFQYTTNTQYFTLNNLSSTGWSFFYDGADKLSIDTTGKLTTSSIYSTDISCNTIHLGSDLYVNSTTISPTVLSYLDGATSNIQNQINALVSGLGSPVVPTQIISATTLTAADHNKIFVVGGSTTFTINIPTPIGNNGVTYTFIVGNSAATYPSSYISLSSPSTYNFNGFTSSSQQNNAGNLLKMYDKFWCRIIAQGTNWKVIGSSLNDIFTNQLTNSGNTILKGNLSVDGTLTFPAASISDSYLSTNIPKLNAANTFTSTNTISGETTFTAKIKQYNSIYLPANGTESIYLTPNCAGPAAGNTVYCRFFASSTNCYIDYADNFYFRQANAINGSASSTNQITFSTTGNINAPSITTPNLTVSSLLSATDISCNTISIAGSNVQTQINGLIPKIYTFDTISAATTLSGGLSGKHFIVSGTSVFTITIPSAVNDGYAYSFFVNNTGAAYPNYITLFAGSGVFSGFTPSTQQGQTSSFKLYQRSHISVRANGTSWIVEGGSFLDLYPNNFTNFGDTTLKGNLTAEGTITLPSNSVSDTALTTNIPKLNSTQTFSGTNTFSNALVLPAASISDSYLSTNVTLDNAANTFTAQNTFNSNIVTGTSSDIKSGRHIYMTSGNAIYYSNTNGTISGTTYLRIAANGTNSFIDFGDGTLSFRPYDTVAGSNIGNNVVFTRDGRINHFGLNGRQGTAGTTTSGQFWNQWWVTASSVLQCYINTTNVGNFTISDKRIKENFTPPSPCLDRLCSIPMTNYELKNTGIFSKGDKTHLGFFAQDLQDTFPELNSIVDGDRDALTSDGEIQPMTINPEFVNVLMRSIQELNEKVEKQQLIIEKLMDKLDMK